MRSNIYDKCVEEISELLLLADSVKNKIHVITVFDNPYEVEAPSGMIYPTEIEDVESGFACSALNYTGYSNFFQFKKDIEDNKFRNPDIIYLVYSTAQLGKGVSRRVYVPLLCSYYSLINLTCDAYRLCLLMDKAHHFQLLKPFLHIPKTIVYSGQIKLHSKINSEYIIVKPSLECAALGVKKIHNHDDVIMKNVLELRKLFNQNIIVQEYIDGFEVSVPVIKKGDKHIALPPVWVQFDGDILTFDSVDGYKYKFAVLPDENFPFEDVILKISRHAEQVMHFIGSDGLTRVDYRIKSNTEYFIFDIAALPVLADTGTCMQSFKYLFSDSNSIFKAIIGSALYQSDQ